MKTRLLFTCLFALFACFNALHADSVTCDDGQVRWVSPFNPHPCGLPDGVEPPPDDPGPVAPIDFQLVFGPPPGDLRSLSNREVVEYLTFLRIWRGIIDVPTGFTPAQIERANETFMLWFLDPPVFFDTSSWGERAGFLGLPVRYNVLAATALRYPYLTVAFVQIKLIQSGFCVPELHPYIPPRLVQVHSRCSAPG